MARAVFKLGASASFVAVALSPGAAESSYGRWVLAALLLGAVGDVWLPAAGAVVFAASDLSVARDRFIVNESANKAWGLPACYVAQLMMAASVTASW